MSIPPVMSGVGQPTPSFESPVATFTAQYPKGWLEEQKQLRNEKIKKIALATLILPVGILWAVKKTLVVAMTFFAQKVIEKGAPLFGQHVREGGGIGKFILASLNIDDTQKSMFSTTKTAFVGNPDNQCSEINLTTPDDIKLNGAVLWNKQEDYAAFQKGTFPRNQKWVILFQNAGSCYEAQLERAKDYAAGNGCNVLIFNHRGVMNSEGYPESFDDLVLDADTAFQFLKQYDSNIVADGHSLGGAVATQMIGRLHPTEKLCSNRSLSSFSNVLSGMVYNKMTLPFYLRGWVDLPPLVSCFAAMTAWVVRGIVRTILTEARWEVDNTKVWEKINGYKWIVIADADEVMQYEGHLYHPNKIDKTTKKVVHIRPGLNTQARQYHMENFEQFDKQAEKNYQHHLQTAFSSVKKIEEQP